MTITAATDMPAPVRAYFDAMNNFDSAAMVAAFADDALVNDIQREFWGADSIIRWADREIVGDKVITTKYLDAQQHYGDYIVSAAVDGDYDKTGVPDPLILTFYFSIAGDTISRLIILANKPGY